MRRTIWAVGITALCVALVPETAGAQGKSDKSQKSERGSRMVSAALERAKAARPSATKARPATPAAARPAADAGRREGLVERVVRRSRPEAHVRPSDARRTGVRERRPDDEGRERRGVDGSSDPALWRHYPRAADPADGYVGRGRRPRPRVERPRTEQPVVIVRERVVRERWGYGGYGPSIYYEPFGFWHWHWYHDPYWHGHTDVVFVFRRGHGHIFHRHHRVRYGHHHSVYLHHGYFHDYLWYHHGHVHFVILVSLAPRYFYVPVYHAPPGWVIEEREVPVLVRDRVPGAYYPEGTCARLEIVTREGSVLEVAVDPADFGAQNVGELRDILEEALAARGELDFEDLSGVRHVVPRDSIKEIRGTACEVD